MLGNRREMASVVAPMQDTAVNLRMQRLDAPIQHFRKPGQLGNVFHRDARFAQQLSRAAGRDEFDAELGKFAGKINQSRFVGNAKNGALDSRHEALGSEERF